MELLNKPIAAICKSLADENRLRILQTIGREKKSVSQIVEALDLSQPLPTILHYGDSDPIMPMDKVERIKARHPGVELCIYPAAGHAFCNPEQATYDATAAQAAWRRSFAFLDRHFSV